ncbi:phage portal protein [Dermacoccus nishinomiyaensis]|uniref:phage portal protein n=1 Tax=Dermacoccus nishinomiyaensis TaxID=1274 RepID=UPI00248E83FD|nr:phage portal protein [Dermacoccus nishinomiyaensis]
MSTITDTATRLAQAITARDAGLAADRAYLSGRQPLAFLSAAARDATRMGRMASNIPAVQVNAVAERLRVVGLTSGGAKDEALWACHKRNDLDQLYPLAFREALGLGSAFATVWDREGVGEPVVTFESPEQVVVERDPVTRRVVAALKRVDVAGQGTRAWLYLPDAVVPLASSAQGAVGGWQVGQAVDNPLGVVPVVELANAATVNGPGVSEIEDLKPLVDGLNKILSDMMVGSEYYARPRRWASGVEMPSDDDGNPVNPFPEGDRMMVAESVEARFGSLPAADLASYEAGVKVLLGQVMAVSALPAHYLGGLTGQTPGADGLRAAEAALSARAEAKQALFGPAVEAIGRLQKAILTGTRPDEHEVRVRWADPATRSQAAEDDGVVKLFQAGLLPPDYALARLGYDDDEITRIRAARISAAAEQLRLAP